MNVEIVLKHCDLFACGLRMLQRAFAARFVSTIYCQINGQSQLALSENVIVVMIVVTY